MSYSFRSHSGPLIEQVQALIIPCLCSVEGDNFGPASRRLWGIAVAKVEASLFIVRSVLGVSDDIRLREPGQKLNYAYSQFWDLLGKLVFCNGQEQGSMSNLQQFCESLNQIARPTAPSHPDAPQGGSECLLAPGSTVNSKEQAARLQKQEANPQLWCSVYLLD
ncbi:hypothetical protein NCU10444 [Neurospora crassa OR74A]|uniref:Uncharacterized protein n=1 Tax=Neurospora crassa (strain ATCC 24698 / 74-OR23-1A / CBS 708.71 / DSM 1257 / FGSC 987) TaxID=367110 RepID=A7UX42_NEUCR|nr:hypothetical protein NCU10444 [Neurospora crassa OR74A]EDO65003.2 hypothetical protein NCU10444 [Neurospora crassa OR74A]|eukprot:XP_001728094.2 hypothetical protein NCU10444 [Neurospora crassa OR74A]